MGIMSKKWNLRAMARILSEAKPGLRCKLTIPERNTEPMVIARPKFNWKLRTRSLELGQRTLVMGVVNITPDSFSDAGRFHEFDHAMAQSLRLIDEGADILDIGGESTRPGKKQPVTAEMERERVVPVIQTVLRERPGTVISIDTYHASTARAAVDAGADIVNDVSGFLWDAEMAQTCKELACGVVLMHMRGKPEEWRNLPPLSDPVKLVKKELAERLQHAVKSGVETDRIVLDPGFGFGKNFDENYPLLAQLQDLHPLGRPLLAGTSRKSFLGRTLAMDGVDAPPNARVAGTMATVTAAILAGAHIVRVHDVAQAVDTALVADAIRLGAELE
jgi:dihydropteroate synthase